MFLDVALRQVCVWNTDVPDQVPELMRRWLNSSFFVAVHCTFHFYYIYRSSHTVMRKVWIHVEMFYHFLILVFPWFGLVTIFRVILFLRYPHIIHTNT